MLAIVAAVDVVDDVVVGAAVVGAGVVVTIFLCVHSALQSKPVLTCFLSVFHTIFTADVNIKGFLELGFFDPQYLGQEKFFFSGVYLSSRNCKFGR